MTRRPSRLRRRIDWEAAHRRLQSVEMGLWASRESATRTLLERAARLAVAPEPEARARDWLEVLTFQRGNTRFALESRFVLEVGVLGRVSRVPGASAALLGISNLRGDLLPIFELTSVVDGGGGGEGEQAPSAQLIVLGEGEPEFGVLADRVDEVGRLAVADMSEAHTVGALAHPEFVRGIGVDGRVVLDGHALLRDRQVFVAKGTSGFAPERDAS